MNNAESVNRASHWDASIELQLQVAAGRSRLTRCHHQGPLYVQKPFYPEGPKLPHIYLLHPPGGLVSGDILQINMSLEAGAGALLTTPGAGRVYRARSDRSLQSQQCNFKIAAGASLEWLPLETIVYRDANAKLETRVELAEGAHFFGWEVISLGLPASGVDFDKGELQQRFCIEREGEPLLIENLHLAGVELASASAGLQGYPILGLAVAGPFGQALDGHLMVQSQALFESSSHQYSAGVSHVGEFVVARFLGECSAECRRLFTELWALLRPALLGRTYCPPRVWA